MIGLTLYGASMAAFVRSGLGMIPWDVLHYGISLHVPLSLGIVVILTSLLVLVLWIPLREMPGLGTIANAVWIGVALDATMRALPAAHGVPLQSAYLVAGVAGNALATAMYIGAQFGPGPRDGLMTSISRQRGWSIRAVRTGIEVAVVLIGIALGGVFGLGTIAYALLIGPLVQWMLPPWIVQLEPPNLSDPQPV